nr:hypothetical protein [Bacteroidota bacterium]
MFWNFVGAIDNPNPQPFSIIYFQPIQVGSILGLCTQPEPLMSEAGRNALFGAAIGDSSITDYDSLEYANSDKTTFMFWQQKILPYYILAQHPMPNTKPSMIV